MRRILKLWIGAAVMFSTCSCVKFTTEYYMKHLDGVWFQSVACYGTNYKAPISMRKRCGYSSINTLYVYAAADGTYTIKDDPTFNDESYNDGYIHDLRIKILPENGILDEGMVFRIEDQNLEMTAIYETYERDYDLKASAGILMIDRIYDDNSVGGRFEFREDDLWEFSEGVFILDMKNEE